MLFLKLMNVRQVEMDNMLTVLKICASQVYEMAELLHNLFKILVLRGLYVFMSFCLREMLHFLCILSQQLYIRTQY